MIHNNIIEYIYYYIAFINIKIYVIINILIKLLGMLISRNAIKHFTE